MSAAIVSIGTELTRGEVTDTNAPGSPQRLTTLGFEVEGAAIVDDDEARLEAALRRLGAEPRVVVCTGGLGPTTDDLTVATAPPRSAWRPPTTPPPSTPCAAASPPSGRETTGPHRATDARPKGSEVLGNPAGLAPAFRARVGAGDFFFLPGVPAEMERIFEECVTRSHRRPRAPRSHQVVLRTYGAGESAVAERLAGLAAAFPGLTVGYRARFPEVDVKLLARADDPSAARALAERAAAEARNRLGELVFGDHDDLYAAAVGRSLRAGAGPSPSPRAARAASSAAVLTAVPGASEYLLLDAVVYANAAKESVLGVPAEVLAAHGAVSGECVRAMAEGARRTARADLAIAVTGVAGPAGGSAEKPVGTVFFALASARGTEVRRLRFRGDRERCSARPRGSPSPGAGGLPGPRRGRPSAAGVRLSAAWRPPASSRLPPRPRRHPARRGVRRARPPPRARRRGLARAWVAAGQPPPHRPLPRRGRRGDGARPLRRPRPRRARPRARQARPPRPPRAPPPEAPACSRWSSPRAGPLAALARAVDDACFELGFPREGPRLSPHVTLCRVKAPGGPSRPLTAERGRRAHRAPAASSPSGAATSRAGAEHHALCGARSARRGREPEGPGPRGQEYVHLGDVGDFTDVQ
jgi:nicotinamide-nucleotide amidase